jgi:hypothetical protein
LSALVAAPTKVKYRIMGIVKSQEISMGRAWFSDLPDKIGFLQNQDCGAPAVTNGNLLELSLQSGISTNRIF